MVRFEKDNFLLIGISYKTAPVEVRNRLVESINDLFINETIN